MRNVKKAIKVIEKELEKKLALRYDWEEEYKDYPSDELDEAINILSEDIRAMERTKIILSST